MIQHDFTSSYYFHNEQWQQMEESNCYTNFQSEQNLKIGEFNVLFGMPNCILQKFARNQQRFNYILNTLIPNVDPDILSMMEVTQEFMDLLLQNDNIRQKYFISHAEKIHQKRLFEVVIISKQPFSTVYLKDSKQGRYQYSIFANREQWKSFIVISAHLWAGEDDYKSRQKQLQLMNESLLTNSYLENKKISAKCKQTAIEANRLNNVILQGDLNLHMRHEDSFIEENGFVDVWKEVYSHEDGYTWDPQENNYIKSVFIFDNRRMRLDRILIRKKCNLFTINDIEILAKEKIGFGLSCSDHFLLLSHLKINSSPRELVQQYDTQNIVREPTTGFRTIRRIIQIRKGVAIGITIVILGLSIGLPLFFLL